jgi:hypothetical protein
MSSKLLTLSPKKFIFYIDLLTLVFSIIFVRFLIALGYRYDLIFRGIGTIPILAALILNLHYIRKNRIKIEVDKKIFLLTAVFMFIWIQGILRSALNVINFNTIYFIQNLISFLLLGLFVAFAFIANPEIEQRKQLRKGLVYAFGLYIVINLVFYLLGIDTHDPIYLTRYPAQMLNLIGIKSYRVLFPMADGINSFGLLAGAVLVGHYQLLKLHTRIVEKIAIFFAVLVCFIVILLTDSRGALLFSIISIAILYLSKNIFKYIRWSPFFISSLPIFILIFAPGIFSTEISWLNRPRSEWTNDQGSNLNQDCQQALANSSGMLSNRPIIWRSVVDELSHFKLIYVVGFGQRGQVVSDISERYACLFASYSYNLSASTHNIWLQSILDIGFIGLIITVLLLVNLILKITSQIDSDGNSGHKALLNILLYIILIGSIEAPLSPDYFTIFVFFIYITVSVFTSIPRNIKSNPVII